MYAYWTHRLWATTLTKRTELHLVHARIVAYKILWHQLARGRLTPNHQTLRLCDPPFFANLHRTVSQYTVRNGDEEKTQI